MGGLGAIEDDVRFDWLAAEDLAAELRATATVLEEQDMHRENARIGARTMWQGRYAFEFDERTILGMGDALRFVTALRDAADDLDELARLAREEQQRREDARAWVESQNDGGGGIGGFVSDLADTAQDFVFGEDDIPPELAPVDPPSIPVGEPEVVTRTAPPAAPVQVYETGGTSSARPEDLDSWVSTSAAMDDSVRFHHGALGTTHDTFTSGLGWGSFDATSLIDAVGTWLSWNSTDCEWVTTIATGFREAGGDVGAGAVISVPDAVLAARIEQAGLDQRRTSVTFDDPIVWGEAPTSGYADDPVNTASGNFVESEVDIDGRGLCRLLRHTRTYNSRSDVVGPFGPGWGSWVSVRLHAELDGAHWVGPDGQQAVIPRDLAPRRSPDEPRVGYRRMPGVPGVVVADEDTGGLVLDALDGSSRLVFDTDGRPAVLSAGPGTEIRFRHDATGRLIGMRHEGGRTVTFQWADTGTGSGGNGADGTTGDDGARVIAARCSDGRAVTYRYDGAGRLVEADGGPRGVRRYGWDDDNRVVTVTDADGVVEARNRYDDEGRVVEQASPHGRTTRYRYLRGGVTIVDDDADGPSNSYVYDDHGRLVGAIDGHGNELRKMYDRWGNPTQVVERDGTAWHMSWDDRGQLVRRQAPDGSWFRFAYDDRGRVIEVTASTGATTRMLYIGSERTPSEIVDPEGGVLRLDVADGRVRRITDPDGVSMRCDHDADGELVAVTDADGHTTRIERDLVGRVVATVTATGLRSEITYDAAGRPVERHDPSGGVVRYEWSPAGRLLAVVDPTGGRREVRYGEHGEAEQLVDELGHVTTRRFDALGNLAGVVLPDGAKWDFDYDQLCRLTGVTDPAGSTWLWDHDSCGRVTGTTDPVGVQRSVAYDPAGRAVGVEDGTTSVAFDLDALGRAVRHRRPDGTEAAADYDRCGRIVAVTDPSGGVTRYEYTAAGRLAAVTSPLGHTTRNEYDRCGRLVGVVDPAGHRWSYRYDPDNLLTRVVAPTGEVERLRYRDGRLVARVASAGGTTRYEHDAAGRVVAVTDPTGGVTRYRWDPRGQLVAATDPNGGVTRYERDERGLLRTVVDPLGGRVEHRYDAAGRLTERVDQLGRSTRWEHDPAGRLVRRVLPTGEQVRWSYDRSGRVVTIGTGDGEVVRIERDTLGRPVVVAEPGFHHQLGWDRHGRLVAKSRNGLSLRWRYDANGRRVATEYPDGNTLTWAYDERNRPTTAEHPRLGTVHLTHDAAGRLTERRTPASTQRWTYRDRQLVRHETEPTRSTGPATTPSHDLGSVPGSTTATELERDARGRVVAATTNGARSAYSYDPAGQLVAVDAPSGAWNFAYDDAGRLATERAPTGETTYTYDAAHQLTARHGHQPTTFRYDEAGRRVAETDTDGQSRTYTWDWQGRLSSVDNHQLKGDALGDLAEVDGRPLLWDSTDPIPQLRWIDGTTVAGDGAPWATLDPDGTATWLDPDWQGTVAGAQDADAWGAGGVGMPALGLGYRGELHIDDMVWLRNRAYDPTTRAFLSPDPLAPVPGSAAAGNPYNYAGNDPVGSVDPLGLRPMTETQFAEWRTSAAESGIADRASNIAGGVVDWAADNWEYFAAGAMMVAGGALIMVGAAPLGGALLAAGISTASQRLVNGEVNWAQVGIDGGIGYITGGASMWASTTRVGATTAGRVLLPTAIEVGGGMVQRQLSGQDPFDAQGMVVDTVTSGTLNSVDAASAARASASPLDEAVGGVAEAIPSPPHVDPTPLALPSGPHPIETPRETAYQHYSESALTARTQVESGAQLWRMGTTGQSGAGEAQFWALEHPSTPGYAGRYGLPPENVTDADFLEVGTLPSGTPFVTRAAPPVGTNPGGGIEVVVPPGSVQLGGFSYVGPKGIP